MHFDDFQELYLIIRFIQKNLRKYYLFFMTYYITKDILIRNYLFDNLRKIFK